MRRKFYFLQEENKGDGNSDGGGSGGGSSEGNKGDGSGNQNQNQGDGSGNQNQNQDGGSGNQSQDENNGDGSGSNDGDFSEAAQKVIKDLRAENAKHRTSNNNLTTRMEKFENGFKKMFGSDDDELSVEEKLEKASQQLNQSSVRESLLSIAIQNGSGKDEYEYFEFLTSKRLGALKEGQELSEEDLDGVLEAMKSHKPGASTSTGDGDGGKPPKGGATEVTQEEFDKMGITAKSLLYQKKPDLYNKLAKNL